MADLTCGQGGSTGAEIVADINANTTAVAEIKTTQRFFGAKISAYLVPDAYGAAAITLNVPSIPAGRYLVSYSLQLDFNTKKDKQIAYRADVQGFTGAEVSATISVNDIVSKVDTNYSYYKDYPAGAFSMDMFFRDAATGQGLIVDFADVMLQWLGDTPAP